MSDFYEIQMCSGGWYNINANGERYPSLSAAIDGLPMRWREQPKRYVWRIIDTRTGDVVRSGAPRGGV